MDDHTKKKSGKIGVQKNAAARRKMDYKWVVTVIIMTFILSSVMSLSSSGLLEGANIYIAITVVIVIIFIGIFFDIIGVAVTAADETPFNSLASRKIAGSKQAIRLVRNAEKVGSFCNDVIGDIAGIVSGSASAAIVMIVLVSHSAASEILMTVITSSVISALTVGGKAVGKYFAFSKANYIVFQAGRLIYVFDSVFRRKKR